MSWSMRVEYVCSSKTTVQKIYRNERYPSYLLDPIIPKDGLG